MAGDQITAEIPGARAVELRAVAELIPYARNARTHSEAQVALIARSIREFGFNNRCWSMARTGSLPGMDGFWRRGSWG